MVTRVLLSTGQARVVFVGLVLVVAGSVSARPLDPTPYVVHPPAGEAHFAFRHVAVIDVAAGVARRDLAVVIRGSRIALVVPENVATVPDDVRSIDASGQYLMPGLWDMHVHAQGDWSESGPLLVTYGVTGIREAWGPNWNARVRAAIDSGALLAPRAVVAGNLIDGPQPMHGERALAADSPATGRDLVDSLAARNVPFLKVYHTMSRDTYFAIADRARRHSLPFAGHIPPSVTAIEASDAGQRSIEHLFGILPACTNHEREHLDNRRDIYYRPEQGAAVLVADFNIETCRAVTQRLAANRTWVTPTLIATSAWYRLPEEPFGPQPLQVTPWQAAYFGVGLHDELALLVSAGLSPAQALRTATTAAAEFFDATDRLGTVTPGKLADLVLLDADPLEDIRNTRTVAAVVLNGRLIERDELLAARLRVFADIHTQTLTELVPESGAPTLEIHSWPEVQLTTVDLSRYEGSYLENSGRTRVWLEDGRLRYESGIGAVDLVPMGDHVFATGRYRDGELAEIYWPDETMVFYLEHDRVAGFRVMRGETAVFEAPRMAD